MKVWNSQMLAYSLAGHDKGTLYLVLAEDQDYYMLADGKIRLLDKPKKKKKKHVQIIKNLPDALLAQMQEITLDAHVKKIIKAYLKSEES